MIKSLVIDDEPLACASLSTKIANVRQNYNVKTVTSPTKGLEIISQWKPDLLFLDITMPGLNGFELLDQIEDGKRNFSLIFCTAYSDFALQAFDEAAIDYLVKPVEMTRLEKSLNKFEKHVLRNWQERYQKLENNPLKKLALKKKGVINIFCVDDVGLFTSKDHETVACIENNEYFCDLSLSSLEKKLEAGRFIRSHRSFLVNLNMIEFFDSKDNVIKVKGCSDVIPVSKRNRANFLSSLLSIGKG
ncbi:MAG: LytTR family DNA-binding domain-containing protein [Bdellovibrionota bacterium]